MNNSTTISAPAKSWVPSRKGVIKTLGWSAAIVVLVMIGVVLAMIPRASDSNALQAALTHVESGSIPDETPEFAKMVESESKVTPDLKIEPGTYTHVATVNGVAYTVALILHDGGKYEYALQVGNERVHKTYSHSGRWWIDGKVLHTVLTQGDKFLTAPASRDSATPSRERIVHLGQGGFTLKAHYGPEVEMTKVQTQ